MKKSCGRTPRSKEKETWISTPFTSLDFSLLRNVEIPQNGIGTWWKKLKQPRKTTTLFKGRILDAHVPPPDAWSLWINLKLWKTHQNCHLFLACPFFHSQVPWSTAFTGDIPIVSYSCPMHVWLQHITTSLQLHSLRIHPGETALVTPVGCCWQSALRISGSKLTSKDKARSINDWSTCVSVVTLVVHRPQGSYAYRIHGLEGVRGKGWKRVGVSDCWDSNEQTDTV